MTIRQASTLFIAFHETEGTRRKTVVKYRGILNNFASFAECEGVSQVSDVDQLLVDRFREFRKRKIGPTQMRHDGSLLKAFLGWCVERNLLAANPLQGRKFKRPKQVPKGGPDLEQVNRILRAAATVRFPVWATLAFSGMRSGECQRLEVSDVDLPGNWLHIVSRPDGLETKTGESRKVPIHRRLRLILEKVPKRERRWFFTALPSPRYPEGLHWLNPKH